MKKVKLIKREETLKSLPKNLSIVLAFAGDSTITRFFDITYLNWTQKYKIFFYV